MPVGAHSQGGSVALDIGRKRLGRAVVEARGRGQGTPDVVIVGGGLSGLGMAIQLCRSGLTSFTIVERSTVVGGTWRDNAYPGSGCDVPSHLYSFSFAPKADWTRRYATQPEILSYAHRCVREFGLGPHLRLGTTVEGARFDPERNRWLLTLTSAEGNGEIEADTVIFACGQLNRPHVPDLPGLDRFSGPAWHSARWDHAVPLVDREVAVIGNGASAVQFVPPVATQARSVTVFQRSANYVAPKRDRRYSQRTRWLFTTVRPLELLHRWLIYWMLEARWIWFRKESVLGRRLGDFFAKAVRAGVVSDRLPEATVIPDYPLGCKRILISNEWYPTLLRPNVSVVSEEIDHLEPDAVVTADGRRHPTDAIIFGTGFSTTDFLAEIAITGADGEKLSNRWQDGAHAYLGVAVPDFPNCYLLYGPNTNLGHNSILFMVERQINLILQAVAVQTRAAIDTGTARVEVTDDAYRRADERVQSLMANTAWVAGCRSWYKTATGRVTNNWPTWTVRYWWDTLRYRPDEFTVTSADRRARAVADHSAGAGQSRASP
ncbi:MAG: flavin-containing monooxygenase [Acidimicrobiales bacterium]